MKLIFTALIIMILTISCDMPELVVESGSMNLAINNSDGRTLAPTISMEAHSYQISGVGPDGNTLSLLTSQEQNLIQDLKTGDWFILIEALNIDGTVIGNGSGSITVLGGNTVTAFISVTPLDGTGTLDLTMFWNTADVVNPVVSATLIPFSGTDISLTFTETVPGTSAVNTTVTTGYYTLVLQLLDTDKIVMGSVETVRIVADQPTSGTFDFTAVNSIGGTIDIDINVDMENPIEIALSGTLATMITGDSMSVTASAPLETVSVNYSWYINGSPAGSGSTMSIGSSLSSGIYRLDVIALTTDGSRSGSISHMFTVTN